MQERISEFDWEVSLMTKAITEFKLALIDNLTPAIERIFLALKLFAMTIEAINRQRLYEKLRRFMPDRWAYDLADVWPNCLLGKIW